MKNYQCVRRTSWHGTVNTRVLSTLVLIKLLREPGRSAIGLSEIATGMRNRGWRSANPNPNQVIRNALRASKPWGVRHSTYKGGWTIDLRGLPRNEEKLKKIFLSS
jgi:hypothetical protein